jgi:hypothetical protein
MAQKAIKIRIYVRIHLPSTLQSKIFPHTFRPKLIKKIGSRIYYLAVRSAAGSLYELIQEEVEKGRVICTVHKPAYGR